MNQLNQTNRGSDNRRIELLSTRVRRNNVEERTNVGNKKAMSSEGRAVSNRLEAHG